MAVSSVLGLPAIQTRNPRRPTLCRLQLHWLGIHLHPSHAEPLLAVVYEMWQSLKWIVFLVLWSGSQQSLCLPVKTGGTILWLDKRINGENASLALHIDRVASDLVQ